MPVNDIVLQRATVADVAQYLAVERTAIGPKTYSGITDEREARWEIETNVVYFIKKGGEIAGTIQYEPGRPARAYVSGIVVMPEFEGKGVARGALHLLFKELEGIRRIDAVVHPHNVRSLRLFLSFGFIIESWKDNFFDDGEPRVVLVRIQEERQT